MDVPMLPEAGAHQVLIDAPAGSVLHGFLAQVQTRAATDAHVFLEVPSDGPPRWRKAFRVEGAIVYGDFTVDTEVMMVELLDPGEAFLFALGRRQRPRDVFGIITATLDEQVREFHFIWAAPTDGGRRLFIRPKTARPEVF